jgi:predicted Ser/Thr protein kinase
MDDEVGIVSIDYCFDVSEDVQIVEKLFQKIT